VMESAPSAGPIPAVWFKSSYSGGEGNECVEVAHRRVDVGVRDSKACDGPALSVPVGAWSSFVEGVKYGLFDGVRNSQGE